MHHLVSEVLSLTMEVQRMGRERLAALEDHAVAELPKDLGDGQPFGGMGRPGAHSQHHDICSQTLPIHHHSCTIPEHCKQPVMFYLPATMLRLLSKRQAFVHGLQHARYCLGKHALLSWASYIVQSSGMS